MQRRRNPHQPPHKPYFTWDSKFTRGQYRGRRVSDIAIVDPSYILWTKSKGIWDYCNKTLEVISYGKDFEYYAETF